MYKIVQTYENGIWSKTEFETKQQFIEFLEPLFKKPGQYEFDETIHAFREQAIKFENTGAFCTLPQNTKDFREYWDTEKDKCREGAIFKNKGKTWYLPREYYLLLNFLQIYNKKQKDFTFASVWDTQYHLALYETIAPLKNKHCAVLKKRQILSSYYHAAKIICNYYFDKGNRCKIAGSLKDYINEKGLWKYLEEFRDFLNTHTAWYRNSNPDKILNWEQKIEITENGRKRDIGNKSTIMGIVLENDPTNGVGGPVDLFYHEEAGIAPKMDITLEYLLPGLKQGLEYTGLFIAAGSVGDLKQCDPLKRLIFNPKSKDVYAVETDLVDDKGTIRMCGLFIPEQWSMPPYIDEYGNSLVEEALDAIKEQRKEWEKDLEPDEYQLRISQHPINIAEAFAYREVTVFNKKLVQEQIRRIEDRLYNIEYVDIIKSSDEKYEIVQSRKSPVRNFPIDMKSDDKEGVICIYERPEKEIRHGMYYASVDPVAAGKTTSTDSLCSIIVYKSRQEVITHKADGTKEHTIEQDKVVCTWAGRFDDINKTHERLEAIIEIYKAYTVVENNVYLFIQYMIKIRKQKYLVPKNQILFLKEVGANKTVYQDYGWRNTGTLFKVNLLSYAIQFIEEELFIETDDNGNILKTVYGIERIPDIMLLKEMLLYVHGMNVDRLISFAALTAFIAIQEANMGIPKKEVYEEKNLQNRNNNVNFKVSPFRYLGTNRTIEGNNKISRPFKNLK